MAQFQDERTSEPLKVQHGEREESQQQQQDGLPKTSAPASQTKETQVADEQEHEVPDQSPKKSMLSRVKDKAKTYVHKHGYGHSKDDGDEEEGQLEEEQGHDQEKEDTKGEKKEKAEGLNSNFSSRSPNSGSAVSPGSDASSTQNYENSEEGKSSGSPIYDIDPTEKAAEEKNYENSEEGKSYGGPIYDIDPTEKVADSSKFGHGEHQEPAQEETEKRLSTDDVEEAHEETGKSFTDAPSAAESIDSSNPSLEEKEEAHEETGKSLTDKPSAPESIVSSNPAVEEKGEEQAGERYEDDVEEKPKSDAQDTVPGKSYTDSAKGALFSVFGYGGAKPAQEKAAESIDSSNPSVEEKEEAHEETGKSFTDKPSTPESIVSSNPAVEEKGEGQAGERYEDDVEEKPKSDAQDTVPGKSYTDSAKGALFSAFGYGGAKPAQEKADSTN